MIAKLFANWRCRSSQPVFAPGEEIRAYLTGFDAETGLGRARIGDTILWVEGAAASQLDTLVDLRVERFDSALATGQARVQARRPSAPPARA